MFKEAVRGLTKFFTKERVLILIIFLILAWGLSSYSSSKVTVHDQMTAGGILVAGNVDKAKEQKEVDQAKAPEPVAGPVAGPVSAPAGYALQQVANPSELLPKAQNSQWAALNPSAMKQGDVLMPDLLQAGYHIGIDTIGQTLRNANLQLRSDPIISKSDIGPWNQSTIEPDLARVPLEIGQGPK